MHHPRASARPSLQAPAAAAAVGQPQERPGAPLPAPEAPRAAAAASPSARSPALHDAAASSSARDPAPAAAALLLPPPLPVVQMLPPAARGERFDPGPVLALLQRAGAHRHTLDAVRHGEGWSDRWMRLVVTERFRRWRDDPAGRSHLHALGFHGTDEQGMRGITRDGAIRAGPASAGYGDVVCGLMVEVDPYEHISSAANASAVAGGLRRIETHTKHQCCVVFEVRVLAEKRNCTDLRTRADDDQYKIVHYPRAHHSVWTWPAPLSTVAALWVDRRRLRPVA